MRKLKEIWREPRWSEKEDKAERKGNPSADPVDSEYICAKDSPRVRVIMPPLSLYNDIHKGIPTTEYSSRRKYTLSWKRLSAIFLFLMLSIAFTLRRGFSNGRFGFKFPAQKCGHHTQTSLGGLPTHYNLSSGSKIPSVALGVWQASKGEVGAAVKTALDSGYRHIDGAWIYRNEEEVGQALKESGVKRDDVWLTSKVCVHLFCMKHSLLITVVALECVPCSRRHRTRT